MSQINEHNDTIKDSLPGRDTPLGYLYIPPKQGVQIIFILSSFLLAILLGFIISSIPGDLSEFSSGLIYFVFLLVFFLGYGLWASWISTIIFKDFGAPLMKAMLGLFFHKYSRKKLSEFIPSREKAAEILVKAQKATRIFFVISWPVGISGGISTLFMNTAFTSLGLFILVTVTSVLYGYFLSYFGRRGYLPFPEE